MEVHQSGGWDYPGLDLARVFEEVPKVGVATKFSPKLPQASRANGRKIRENLQILEILPRFSSEQEEMCLGPCAAGPPRAVETRRAVLKAFVSAQLIILMGSLGEISTITLAIKNTPALNSVFTYLGIFNQPVKSTT